jgi:hypothetical protein
VGIYRRELTQRYQVLRGDWSERGRLRRYENGVWRRSELLKGRSRRGGELYLMPAANLGVSSCLERRAVSQERRRDLRWE